MALKSLSTTALRRELARREKVAPKLKAEHAVLAKRLAQITAELAELGAEPPARRGRKPGPRGPGRPKGSKNKKPGRPRGKRAKNALTLPEAIRATIKVGSIVSPAEVADAVTKTGFKSTSKHFGMMVSNALAKMAEFARKGRGQYERLAGGGKPAKKKTAKRKGAKKAAKRAGKKTAKRKAGKRKATKRTAKKPASAPTAAPAEATA